MIVAAVQSGAWFPPLGDWMPPWALQQGPDNPLSNLLGYVVVFMVIVWPIIRGVMESAQQKRQEFERGQARKAKARSGAPARRRSLEEIMRGDPYVETLADPTEVSLDELRDGPASRAYESYSAPSSLEGAASGSSHSPGGMGDPNSSPKSRAEGANPTLRPSERELVGDPFDDGIMGQDLVSDEDLNEVPSEEELETSFANATAGEPSSMAPRGPGADESAPAGLGAADRALARLERRLTPWQRALVYREVLGPPASMVSHKPGEI